MRLLFIYFYDDFGTFEKGSIIHLSKKYKFTLDKKKSTEKEFYFNKEENLNFIEDFYSKNIDIGVLIGENGTGKSVLLNSIRDRKNEYSICVYEEENRFYCFLNQKHIFIDNLQITKKELNYIYYTSLIDAFDNDINDKYNISNRAFLKRHDGKNLDIKLSLIENDDIQRYFKMEKKTNYDVEIKRLRINYNGKFFSELKEDFFKKEFINIYQIFINHIKNQIKDIDILNIFNDKYFYNDIFKIIANNISSEELIENIERNKDLYLINNSEILDSSFLSINRKIDKKLTPEFRKQKLRIKSLFEVEEIQKSLQNFFDTSPDILNNLNFLTHIENKEIFESETTEWIVNPFEMTFSRYLESNNIFDFIDNDIFYHIEGNLNHEQYIYSELYDEFLDYIFKYFSLKNKFLSKFLKFKYRSNFLEHFDISYKNANPEDLKKLKLQIDLIHFNYICFENIKNNTKVDILKNIKKQDIISIYFKISDIKTRKYLLILYLEDKYGYEVPLTKMGLINKFIKILEDNNEIIKNKDIFYLLDNNLILNEKLLIDIYNENTIDVNDNFFIFYEKLIKYELKPFTYELYPSLSSGQKAILFIFARINDAIQKINQEKQNENILILLDEADLKLHLEWQRKFVFDLIEFLNSYPNNKFYVLYATHSPMILSDITNDRVVFLKKKDDKYSEDKQDFTRSTFGANIYDIYSDSFFVDDFMSEFAQNKINEVIKIIEKNKKISDKKASSLLKIIKNIGEPLLRNKLEDEIKSLSELEIKDDISIIADKLRDKNFEEIKQELNKYSQEKQRQILEKLFGNQND